MSDKIIWTEREVFVTDLKPFERNPRIITKEAYDRLRDDILEFGYHDRIKCQPGGLIIGGHQRLKALQELGIESIPILEPSRELTFAEYRKLLIKDNLPYGSHDWEILSADFEADELKEWGMPEQWLDGHIEDEKKAEDSIPSVSLADRFGIPPFSILDARQGWWQARKAAWLARGIRSEIGRKKNALDMSGTLAGVSEADKAAWNAARRGEAEAEGLAVEGGSTSVFDATLTELAYRWFCPPGGSILDPFAGGSVRGIVAAFTGRLYTGIDLRLEQLNANYDNSKELGLHGKPEEPYWIHGDSRSIASMPELKAKEFDFIFSCPPYADLEVYSDDPRDLSTMGYRLFLAAYREIIAAAVSKLAHDRFAVFVVGEVRDKKGNFYSFVADTIRAFTDAGMEFYNEAILVQPAANAAMRAGNSFTKSRKLAKTHQNVLVFVKGDAKKAAAAIGAVEFGELDEAGK